MATVSLGSAAGKWIMTSTILASAMAFIDATVLNVVLPALQKSLNATGADLFWILNAYLLILASLILIGGALADAGFWRYICRHYAPGGWTGFFRRPHGSVVYKRSATGPHRRR